MHPFLNTAFQAARQAGRVISRAVDRLDLVTINEKSRFNFVTDVDRQSEQIIIDNVTKNYPSHAILAEESGQSGAKDAEYMWIIDPLDGTTNFIHGFPHFCISIAVQKNGRTEHGLIYDPLRDELFHASHGNGAFLNKKRMRVSQKKLLEAAFLATGAAFRDEKRLNLYFDTLKTLYPRVTSIRRAGSAALDLAYVAAGRLDGFLELGLQPWDVAAGGLIVQEAGGLVGDIHGGTEYLFSEELLAAPLKLYKILTQTMQPILQKHDF